MKYALKYTLNNTKNFNEFYRSVFSQKNPE